MERIEGSLSAQLAEEEKQPEQHHVTAREPAEPGVVRAPVDGAGREADGLEALGDVLGQLIEGRALLRAVPASLRRLDQGLRAAEARQDAPLQQRDLDGGDRARSW